MEDYSIESFLHHNSTDAGIPNFRAHKKRICVKVLKKYSPTNYWIGDKTATCMMRLESEKNSKFFHDEQWKYLEENKSYTINGLFKNDEEENCILLNSRTSIRENYTQVSVPIKSLMKPILGEDTKKVIHITFKSIILLICILKYLIDFTGQC